LEETTCRCRLDQTMLRLDPRAKGTRRRLSVWGDLPKKGADSASGFCRSVDKDSEDVLAIEERHEQVRGSDGWVVALSAVGGVDGRVGDGVVTGGCFLCAGGGGQGDPHVVA